MAQKIENEINEQTEDKKEKKTVVSIFSKNIKEVKEENKDSRFEHMFFRIFMLLFQWLIDISIIYYFLGVTVFYLLPMIGATIVQQMGITHESDVIASIIVLAAPYLLLTLLLAAFWFVGIIYLFKYSNVLRHKIYKQYIKLCKKLDERRAKRKAKKKNKK